MTEIEETLPTETVAASGPRAMLGRILAPTRGRVLAAALVIGIVGAAVWAGYMVLGPGGPRHVGEVRFGAIPSGNVCDVGETIEFLPSGGLVFWSAVFPSTVPMGHEIIVERAKDGVIERSEPFSADRAIDCMGTPLAAGPLYTGTYTLTIRDGATILATGSLTVR